MHLRYVSDWFEISIRNDQPVTGLAMVGSGRFEGFAFPAQALPGMAVAGSSIVGPLSDTIDWSPVVRHAAWTRKACSQIANPNANNKQIELDELSARQRLRLDV